jgi:Phage integrase family
VSIDMSINIPPGNAAHLKVNSADTQTGVYTNHTCCVLGVKKAIVLNAPALDILAHLPRVGEYVVAGQAAGTDDDKPRSDLNRPWRAIVKRAGLTDLRIHDLRHTHASVGAGLGLGLPIIGKLLGHTQPSTTARYAHLDSDPLRRASDHIGNHLSAAMGDLKPRSGGDLVPTQKITAHPKQVG